MKKFISILPYRDNINKTKYDPVDNPLLRFGNTCFPIIPVINGYTEPNEEIEVIVVCYDHGSSEKNLSLFNEEVNELQNQKKFKLYKEKITELWIPHDENIDIHLKTFVQLIDLINDNDIVYSDFSYGNKPLSLTQLLFLSYVQENRKNTYVQCIVYGLYDFQNSDNHRIYDMTALLSLNSFVQSLNRLNVKDIDQIVNDVLFQEEEDE